MRCPKCQSVIYDDLEYCNYCGEPILANLKNNTIVNPTSTTEDNSHNEQYNYSNNYSNENNPYQVHSDEDYLKAYVGDNYQAISTRRINIPALIIGSYYYMYRKMWSLAFIDLFLGLVAKSIPAAQVIFLALRIIIAINFNKLYIEHAKKRVQRIKERNSDKSTNELMDKCRRKGGTSVAAPFVIMFSLMIFIMIVSMATALLIAFDKNIFEDYIDENEIQEPTYENTIGSLSYQIPKDFIKTTYSKTNLTIINFDNNTSIHIKLVSKENYESAKDYLEKHNLDSENSTYEVQTINNYEWDLYKNNKDTESIHYATIKDNYIYYMVINGPLDKTNQEFINNLKFINNSNNYYNDDTYPNDDNIKNNPSSL